MDSETLQEDGPRIGPYRLVRPLGAGGMGVVWEAWDERLERRVALKRVLPEDAADPRRRERFRREARAAARLSHPAIVQIHDLLTTLEGDWIVMELVEGKTLAALLREGPLGLGRLLPVARQIAGGLAEAHAKGILHRDLKTENVIITPAGDVRILDFGLAKRYWGSGEEPLSIAGQVAGTGRAMSPEQANGLDLDPRSDLFSFGSLLYEALTGVSPFQAPTLVETLHKVCSHQPPPACERNPAVPAPLSDLIDRLLEKDRDLRPAGAAEVAARLEELHAAWLAATSGSGPLEGWRTEPTVAGAAPISGAKPRRRWIVPAGAGVLLAAALAAAILLEHREPKPPLYVAVPATEIGLGKGRNDVALAAAGVHAALLRGLTSLSGIAPLETSGEASAPAAITALARSLAANEVATARLDCTEQSCKVSLGRRDGRDGRLLWVDTFEAPIDDFGLLTTAVSSSLRRGLPTAPPRAGFPELDVRSEDYAAYLRLLRCFRAGEPPDPLLAEAAAVRRSSPRFLEIHLLEADLARTRFFGSRQPADLDRALGLLRQARALAPGDLRPLLGLFGVTLEAERLDETRSCLAELERLAPGDSRVLAWKALLAERRGDGGQALRLMRTAAARRPSLQSLLDLSNLEARQGEIAAAHRTLEEVLRRWPGETQAQTRLAQLELLAGDPARAEELYQDLARRSPGFAELSNLGLAQLLRARYAAAAETFRRAAALAPGSAAAALNLADAEQLAGRTLESAALYRKALDLAEHDPAGTFWQALTIKAQALARLGRSREAVSAVQEALERAPANPQVAYEAALVYSLVGDRASAIVLAERALRRGVEPGWFRFPWFDSLRSDPELTALLARAAAPAHR
jgi:eukaryotic-like serine/threonine-protein kinase